MRTIAFYRLGAIPFLLAILGWSRGSAAEAAPPRPGRPAGDVYPRAHHRGQAEIYLRDNGIKPPGYRI